MMQANTETALLLEQHANEISLAASRHLLSTAPDIVAKFGGDVNKVWQQHFDQRILELSTAVAAGEPRLFVSRVNWSREAMTARGQDDVFISITLQSLRYALIEVIHDNACSDVITVLDKAEQELFENSCGFEESSLDPRKPTDRIALQYLQAVLEGNSREATRIVLDEVGERLNAKTAILNVLMPAQREVGRLWHLGEVTIAEEHQVTATTQHTMALIAQQSKHAPDNGYTAVCASVSGNVHDLGIRAISYLLEMEGWRTIYLGADVPAYDLPAAADFYDADVMMLSLALSSQLPKLRSAIRAIRQHKPGLQIMVGGNAFAGITGLWKKIGADGYAPDGEQAILLAKELVTPLERVN
jgi:MerR family transcriptional regulator, light-induced transcriptional regulator